ncbi:hypothetical protein CLOM_g3421 [Closterium sp. NIES-68]|nr:hypothetical protein CLOM_g3421 [Closterium sp. NIES-68]GJP71580.1 hypothetical protein CLOP_g2402 [Closterium sp. NIES-67]
MVPNPDPPGKCSTRCRGCCSPCQPTAGGGQGRVQQLQYKRRRVVCSSTSSSGNGSGSGSGSSWSGRSGSGQSSSASGSERWESHGTGGGGHEGQQEQVLQAWGRMYARRRGGLASRVVGGARKAGGEESKRGEGFVLALGCDGVGGARNGGGVRAKGQVRGRAGAGAGVGAGAGMQERKARGKGRKTRGKCSARGSSDGGASGGEEEEEEADEEEADTMSGDVDDEKDAGGLDEEDGGEEEDEEQAGARVKRALKLYSLFNRRAIKTEEERVTKERKRLGLIGPNGERVPKSKLKGKARNAKAPSKRPDLVAIKVMGEKGLMPKTKTIGAVPGVHVGDRFFARAEMVVVGMHTHWLKGIDCVLQRESPYGKSIAVAVVVSGIYEDDKDNANRIWYTGEGGNNLLGSRKQNSIEVKNDVRVIRGHNCKESDTKRAFTYDGLYKVKEHTYLPGKEGFLVYKFLLVRNAGQPPLTSEQVRFMRGQIPTSANKASDVVCADLSKGMERVPVVVTNCIDKPPTMPPAFQYVMANIMPEGLTLHGGAHSCHCKGACTNESKCACAKRNKDGFSYVQGGRLIKARGIVMECGPSCACGPQCINRVGQRGLRFRLEVYKTSHKGWAVRSWDFIPAGAVVCEYVGEVLPYEQVNHVDNDTYVLSIDTVRTAKLGTQGRDPMFEDLEHLLEEQATAKLGAKGAKRRKAGEEGEHEEVHYAIDGHKHGNVARFINHSCSPNLFYQSALWDHKHPELSHLLLVASENIPPLTELTYDYNYEIGSVMDESGKVKHMKCCCGAGDCRGRLY